MPAGEWRLDHVAAQPAVLASVVVATGSSHVEPGNITVPLADEGEGHTTGLAEPFSSDAYSTLGGSSGEYGVR